MKLTRLLIAAGAALVLVAVNYAIYSKERIVANGRSIYLELAPVDPRSIMQGDYMALRWRIATEIEAARTNQTLAPNARLVKLSIAENGLATLADENARNTIPLQFRVRQGAIWIGTDAYFFSEGQAAHFEQAAYGEFRIDQRSGEAILVDLRDAQFASLSQ